MSLVTSLNINHGTVFPVERIQYLMENTEDHDVVMLQEVHPVLLAELKNQAPAHGWVVHAGALRVHSRYTYRNVTLTRQEGSILTGDVPGVPIEHQVPYLGVRVPDMLVFNTHFPWGSAAEHERLLSAVFLTEQAAQWADECLVVLGGDLNATPQSSTLRYLHGLDAYQQSSTYWTDMWMDVLEPPSTARKTGGWAEDTALGAGVRYPERMPDRTIDYLMTYGWNHGKPGDIEYVGLFGSDLNILPNGYSLSDHHGVTGRILW